MDETNFQVMYVISSIERLVIPKKAGRVAMVVRP